MGDFDFVSGAGQLITGAENLVSGAVSNVVGRVTSLFGSKPTAANAGFTSNTTDFRARLRVPASYMVTGSPAAGPNDILKTNGGILFPYTPSVGVDNKAEYGSNSPLHSNFAFYFFKNAAVGPITVTAKFTVQNEYEGAVLLSVIHLLRCLTKMPQGDDINAGSPPPVCRFDAFGDFMFNNVPVSVASWRHEMPDNVDYITVGRPGSPATYGKTMVPTLSSLNLTLNIMYSRQEMDEYSIDSWSQYGNADTPPRGYL